ncbi:MAG TPA: hypothetical protein VIQ30_05470 [Pseudonocardia sp.]
MPLVFSKTAVTAGLSAVALNVMDTSADVVEYVMPFDFEIVGISVSITSARTAGTLTVDATIDTTVTGLQAVIDATNTQRDTGTQSRNTDVGAAGSRVGVKITTDAGFLPVTTNDVVAVVWVLAHLDGV